MQIKHTYVEIIDATYSNNIKVENFAFCEVPEHSLSDAICYTQMHTGVCIYGDNSGLMEYSLS